MPKQRMALTVLAWFAVLGTTAAFAGPAIVWGLLCAAGIVVASFGFVLRIGAHRRPDGERRRRRAIALLVGGVLVAVVAFATLLSDIDDRVSDWFVT